MMHGFTVGPVQPQCTHTHTHAHRLFHLTVWLDVSFALPVRVWKKITLLSLLCLEMLQFMTFKIHHSLTSSLVLQNCNSWSCFNIWKCPHVSSHACETDIEWVGGGLDKVTICLLFLTQHQLEPPQIITQSWVTRMCQHVLQKVVYTSTAALLTHSLTLVNTHFLGLSGKTRHASAILHSVWSRVPILRAFHPFSAYIPWSSLFLFCWVMLLSACSVWVAQ